MSRECEAEATSKSSLLPAVIGKTGGLARLQPGTPDRAPQTMDLTPEDDDLLSYFLSADVAAERMPAAAAAPAGATAAPEQLAVSQQAPLPHERAFGSAAGAAGPVGASGGAGSVSAFQQMSAGFGASEMSGPRSTTTDDEAAGVGDTDEKRQRR